MKKVLFLPLFFVALQGFSKNFYYKGAGDLNAVSSWSKSRKGTGYSPLNFTDAGQVFVIMNVSHVTLAGNWTVTGTGSKVQVGHPSADAVTLTIDSGVCLNATVDVARANKGNNSLVLYTSCAPVYGMLDTTAVIAYRGTTVQSLASGTFTNLTLDAPSATVLAGDITTTGTLTLGAAGLNLNGHTLTIVGTIAGTGVITGSAASSVVVEGEGSIGGNLNFDQSDSSTRTLNNLIINRTSATITLGSTLELRNTLTLSNGTLHSGGKLVLVSNASGTARIAQVTGTGAITGNVIVERFIPGKRAWRFLAAPAAGQTLASTWQQSIHITGPGTGGTLCPNLTPQTNGFDPSGTTTPSIYTYSETTGQWVAVTNTNSTALNTGTAYRVFVRGARSQGCSLLTSSTAPAQDAVVRAAGTVTTGTVNIPLTCTSAGGKGWNLVSNPYPSAIDWNHPAWVAARGTVNTTLYIWNPALGPNGQYCSWNPIGGAVNGGTNIIQSGQSFFIKTTAACTLTIEEAYKNADKSTGLFGKRTVADNLKIQLIDTAVMDEAVIFTFPSSTHGADNLDGEKMSTGAGTIGSYTSAAGTLLTFNAVEPFATGKVDTIYLKTGLVGSKSYSLNFIGTKTFKAGMKICLYDRYTGSLRDVTSACTYTFTTTSAAASYSATRFSMVFIDALAMPVTLTHFNALALGSLVKLTWNTASETNNSHFVVERSTDLRSFVTIATVKGSTQSNSSIDYSATDADPVLNTINYYRLAQVDVNGTTTYSHTQLIDLGEPKSIAGPLSVSPNPATGGIIKLSRTNAVEAGLELSIEIHDLAGRIVNKSTVISGTDASVADTGMENGIYLLKVYHNGQMLGSEKFAVSN